MFSSIVPLSFFLPDEGPRFETDFTTFLYFDMYLNNADAEHYI